MSRIGERWIAVAPAHVALSVAQLLTNKNIPVMRHPPYSPDLVTCDFFPPIVKSCLKGTHFTSVEEISQVRTAYTQCGKTSLATQNSERKEKLSERDRQGMKRIVTSKKQTTAAKVTAELYQHLNSPVSIITVRRHLHKQNIYGKAAITKPLVTDAIAQCRLHLQNLVD
ncbi:transposable element Tcb1 transposase [Trichonephila clavipes]|nr:transposable element Tcb1 transposase [Trichonephila clavipes]